MRLYQFTNKHTTPYSREIYLVSVNTNLLEAINKDKNFKVYSSISHLRHDWNITELDLKKNGVIYSDCY